MDRVIHAWSGLVGTPWAWVRNIRGGWGRGRCHRCTHAERAPRRPHATQSPGIANWCHRLAPLVGSIPCLPHTDSGREKLRRLLMKAWEGPARADRAQSPPPLRLIVTGSQTAAHRSAGRGSGSRGSAAPGAGHMRPPGHIRRHGHQPGPMAVCGHHHHLRVPIHGCTATCLTPSSL